MRSGLPLVSVRFQLRNRDRAEVALVLEAGVRKRVNKNLYGCTVCSDFPWKSPRTSTRFWGIAMAPELRRAARLVVVDSRDRVLLLQHARRSSSFAWNLFEFDDEVREVHSRESILETRWWSLPELSESSELIFLADLAEIVRCATRGEESP